jgi:DNA-binding HxlR family transcriptional regulator
MDERDLSAVNDLLASKYRLAAMALLAGGDEYDFPALKRELGLTDGNLSSHMGKLEGAGLVSVHKSFAGKKPRTSYRITPAGTHAWDRYLAFLKSLFKEKTLP